MPRACAASARSAAHASWRPTALLFAAQSVFGTDCSQSSSTWSADRHASCRDRSFAEFRRRPRPSRNALRYACGSLTYPVARVPRRAPIDCAAALTLIVSATCDVTLHTRQSLTKSLAPMPSCRPLPSWRSRPARNRTNARHLRTPQSRPCGSLLRPLQTTIGSLSERAPDSKGSLGALAALLEQPTRRVSTRLARLVAAPLAFPVGTGVRPLPTGGASEPSL